MSQADNSGNNADKPYFNIPADRYFWLWGKRGGTAVPTQFFKLWTGFLIAFTFVSTTVLWLTDWWQILITRLLTFFYITHWYVGWPATTVTLVIMYYWYSRRQKRNRRERAEWLRRRRYEDAVIAQNEGRRG